MNTYTKIAIAVFIAVAIFLVIRSRKRTKTQTENGGMKYFTYSEFDSDDAPGSGRNMQKSTLKMLDAARELAGVPFRINSGYRTPEHNAEVGGVSDSAHTRGYAADIAYHSLENRNQMLKSLYAVGFRRFGIGQSYIHVDNDPDKPTPSVWGYKNGVASSKYAPLSMAQIAAL